MKLNRKPTGGTQLVVSVKAKAIKALEKALEVLDRHPLRNTSEQIVEAVVLYAAKRELEENENEV